MNKLDHLSLIGKVLKYADFTEIYEERINVLSVENDSGNIEKCAEVTDWGASLRSFNGDNIYFTATNSRDEDHLLENHLALLDMGENKAGTDFCYEKSLAIECNFSRTQKDYISITDDVYRRLKADVDGLLNAKLSFLKYDRAYTVTNSMGNSVSAEVKGERFAIHLTVGLGNEKFTVYESVGYTFREVAIEEIENIYKICVERAQLMKMAKPGPAGNFPCILAAESGGTLIHEAVGHGLEADLVDKGVSVYGGEMGKVVASKLISVVDDAVYKNGFGSFLVDDEGSPAERTLLIENGVLKNYLYDNFYAFKHNVKSTGNGRRQGYAYKPYPRMTNTFILPGSDNPEDLLKSIDKGVLVKKMGGGQVNTLTGDFIFEILEGYWLEKGEIVYPLKNLSIMGNGPKILQEIDGVGSDFGTAIGTCGKEGQGVPVGDGQPTLRIPQLTVGGRGN